MSGWTGKRRPASEYLDRHKRDRILTRDRRICHVCGHAGADQVDHVVPWAEWARSDLSVHDASNLAAIHGGTCATCGQQCHNNKTQAEAARGVARRAARARRPIEDHPGLRPG